MDLTYPTAVHEALDRLSAALGDINLQEELASCELPPELEGGEASEEQAEIGSPLAQVVEFRKLGEYALPLGELLARAQRRYVPLPRKWSRGGITPLGWPDARAPWTPGEPLTVELTGGKLHGHVSVAPFCVPANRVVFLARHEDGVALAKAPLPDAGVERVGDGFTIRFEDWPCVFLTQGEEAETSWQRLVAWERLALVGLTLGLIDRAYRIGLEALGEAKRAGLPLADEQVAQFQLSDNFIDRLAAERLALDLAVDAENGRPFEGKLAMVRAYTSAQAERCASRALHLAELFAPQVAPIARWLVRRAHHLATYAPAREYEVQAAARALTTSLSVV